MVTPSQRVGASGSKRQAMAAMIEEQGFGVVEGFVESALVASLLDDLERSWRDEAFEAAKVGQGGDRQHCPSVRSDWIAWLDDDGLTASQMRYIERLEGLRLAINRRTMMGLFEWEGHLAVYPRGSFYRRHLDVFRHASERKVSTILYLNEGWKPGDGGELRLYMGQGLEDYVDVQPRAGTLVSFLCEDFYHEVLPAASERRSITGWFRQRS